MSIVRKDHVARYESLRNSEVKVCREDGVWLTPRLFFSFCHFMRLFVLFSTFQARSLCSTTAIREMFESLPFLLDSEALHVSASDLLNGEKRGDVAQISSSSSSCCKSHGERFSRFQHSKNNMQKLAHRSTNNFHRRLPSLD